MWIATLLHPRFKKLAFKGDELVKPKHHSDAQRWLRLEYKASYAGKVSISSASDGSSNTSANASGSAQGTSLQLPHTKRRKISLVSFFADSDED